MVETAQPVSWNLSGQLINQISGLITNSTTKFIEGKIGTAFTILQAIRGLVNHDLGPTEITTLDNLEKDAAQMINIGSIYKGFKIDEKAQDRFFAGRRKYIVYHRTLMGYMKAHGYTIQPKDDTTRIR